ncbi:hypothetical protein GUJ93_ZPchr0011g28035 [Zizania palustris]|uniref:AMP-dependent synthetase/ligase domain-containing protein n=1 Tax=Zizania palustris TaxID=103762 RepID=A0A8J5WI42_ZIZPA|nr:hypothetical protein GUJ93_ZPchr0011g28035 [Zizania palustris]
MPLAPTCRLTSVHQAPSYGANPNSGQWILRRHQDLPVYHCLRAPRPLPPPVLPLSFTDFAFSLLPTPLPSSHPALLDSFTGEVVPFPAFLSRVRALGAHGRRRRRLPRQSGTHRRGNQISHLVALSNPALAFAVSSTATKLPLGLRTVLLDSPTFLSYLQELGDVSATETVVICQSDPAAILHSSGTTERAKAVLLTYRNIMASTTMAAAAKMAAVVLLTVPMFHVYG